MASVELARNSYVNPGGTDEYVTIQQPSCEGDANITECNVISDVNCTHNEDIFLSCMGKFYCCDIFVYQNCTLLKIFTVGLNIAN